jgi:cytochrome c biogenesis protein CcdA
MSEYALRAMAVLLTAFILLAFGVYFGTPVSDTYQRDYIFFGGGVISLLSGLATLGFFVVLMLQRKEYGDDIQSDIGYPEMAGPPPNVGGAAARAAAAASSDDSGDSDSDSGDDS